MGYWRGAADCERLRDKNSNVRVIALTDTCHTSTTPARLSMWTFVVQKDAWRKLAVRRGKRVVRDIAKFFNAETLRRRFRRY